MSSATENDACGLLDADHIAVKHLFVEYARLATASAAKASARRRVALARQIGRELTVHMQLEEEIFYPALAAAQPDAAARLGEARAEHQEARALVARIDARDAADAELDALVAQLALAVEHHVKEERDELFPKAKTAPGLQALGERMRARQQELMAAAGR